MTHIWDPLWLSLRITLAATALTALIAIPLAFALARWRFPGRSLIEALIIVPLVLPPTVVGFFILMGAGSRSALGRLLSETLGISIVFHWTGAVIAATVVALPMLYLPAKAAFLSVERELEDVSRLMGANLLQVFWHVSLPIARRGIASGLLLAFARVLGEFGATVMVYGDLPGGQTLPISIYSDYVGGNLGRATPAVLALSAISVGVILIYNRSSAARQE